MPTNATNLITAAEQLGSQGRWNEAVVLANEAVRADPANVEAKLLLGIAFSKIGETESAAASFEEALHLDGNNFVAALNLASCYAKLGRSAPAEETLEMAMSIAPTERGLERLMELQIENGRPTAALTTGEKAISLKLAGARTHLKLARASTDLGDDIGAAKQFALALEQDPGLAEIYLERGFWHQSRGTFGEAETDFKRAIQLDPKQGVAHFGIVHSRKITYADLPLIEAMRTLVSDPAILPNHRAHLLYALGKANDDLGRPGVAIEFFDQANTLYRDLTLRNRPFDPVRCHDDIDRRIRLYKPELFNLVRPHACNSDLPILVLGMMRSGTTLVEQILSRHPELGGAGEIHFWAGRDNNEDPVNVASICESGRDYVELLARKIPGKTWVIDKNPANFMAAGLIHAALPNARLIHTLRDPADTALSMWITHVTQPPEFCCDRNNIVAMYREYRRLTEHWRAVLPSDRYLEVCYEDLVSDPEPNIRRMISFLGLEWSESCLRPEANDRAVKTPSGWQVRQPLYRSSIGRWKQYEPWIPEFVQLRELTSVE